MYVYGVADTMACIENDYISKIICYENLPHYRVLVENILTKERSYKYVVADDLNNPKLFVDCEKIE